MKNLSQKHARLLLTHLGVGPIMRPRNSTLPVDFSRIRNTNGRSALNCGVKGRKAGNDIFTLMTASADPADRLYISKVLHKAFVEVNEKGTEAAAATGLGQDFGGSSPKMVPFWPTFRADRSFLYLVRDNETGTILFLGRLMNPNE